MKVSKMIFKLLAISVLANLIVFSAQANCPKISEIIAAFNKNSLPPKGWLLIAYTGKQIDHDFHFNQASWNAISTYDKTPDGNIECEYVSRNKANPGYLIVQTTETFPAPAGDYWQKIKNANKTTICKEKDNLEKCKF